MATRQTRCVKTAVQLKGHCPIEDCASVAVILLLATGGRCASIGRIHLQSSTSASWTCAGFFLCHHRYRRVPALKWLAWWLHLILREDWDGPVILSPTAFVLVGSPSLLLLGSFGGAIRRVFVDVKPMLGGSCWQYTGLRIRGEVRAGPCSQSGGRGTEEAKLGFRETWVLAIQTSTLGLRTQASGDEGLPRASHGRRCPTLHSQGRCRDAMAEDSRDLGTREQPDRNSVSCVCERSSKTPCPIVNLLWR